MKVFLVFYNGNQYILECIKSTRSKADEYVASKAHPTKYEIEVWDIDE